MNRLNVRPHFAILTVSLCVVLSHATLRAQALKARVSVKFILDAEGNRPVEEGFTRTDLDVETHIALANEILETNGADWRLELVEIEDVAGFSQWYDQAPSPIPGASSPASLFWRADAINIYVINSETTTSGVCRVGTCESIWVTNRLWLGGGSVARDEVLLLAAENPPEHQTYFIGQFWLHEIGHYFNLEHTQGDDCGRCSQGQTGECHTVPGNDQVNDTIPDLQCWDPDRIALSNFGVSYDDASIERRHRVDFVWKNTMSYHYAGIFADREAFLTPGQLERMAREMDPVTGRRAAVLERLLWPEFTLSSRTVDVAEMILMDGSQSRAEGEHALVSWEWDFADGMTDDGEIVTHAYAEAGIYPVQLTITDDRDLRTTTTQQVVVLSGPNDIAPWVSTDIGDTGYASQARLEGEDLTVAAGGKAFANRDNLHFVHQEFVGDTVITARIARLLPDGAVSAVGLMLRESLDPGSKHASIIFNQLFNGIYTEANMKFIRRSGLLPRTTTSDVLPDTWVRIERRGDEFIGYHSDNGIFWTELGHETIELPEVIFGGVAVTAINTVGNDVVLAEVSNLYIGDPPDPRYIRGDGNGDGRVNIADASYVAGTIFGFPVAPITCEAAADANGDGGVNIADPTYIANFLFGIGPATEPPAPYPECALVPPEEPLSCMGTEGCLD